MAGLNMGLYNAALSGQNAAIDTHMKFLRSADAINQREQQIEQQRALSALPPNRNAGVTASLGDLSPPPATGGFSPIAPRSVGPAPGTYMAAPVGPSVGSPTAGPAAAPVPPAAAGQYTPPPRQVRAGLAGAKGVTQINPQASQFMQDLQSMRARGDVAGAVNRIGDGLAIGKFGPAGNLIGDVWGYFSDTPDIAGQRSRVQTAMQWYKSDQAKQFFLANPEALDQAAQDPVGTYERLTSGQQSAGLKGDAQFISPQASPQDAINQAAAALQIDPVQLAALISYETAGTFNPWQKGPTTKHGQHRGLIQWGATQRKEFGVTKNMSFGEQMQKVVEYATARGFVPGQMGIMELYSTVNAGRPGLNTASDVAAGGDASAPTVADKVTNKILGEHMANAERFMGGNLQPTQDQPAAAKYKVPDWAKDLVNKAPAQLSQDYNQLSQVRDARRQAVQTQLNTLARRRADLDDKINIARRTQDANLMARYMDQRDAMNMEMDSLRAKYQDDDLKYVQRMAKLQTDDALLRLSLGDPSMAAQVYTQQTGLPVAFEMRADGKLNIYMRGPDGVERSGVADVNTVGRMLREHGDERYRDMSASASAARSGKEFESQLKMLEKQAEQIGQLTIEKVKAGFDAQKEMQGYQKAILSPDGTAIVLMSKDGSHALRYTPDKVTEGPDGEPLYSNAIEVVRGPDINALKAAGLRTR